MTSRKVGERLEFYNPWWQTGQVPAVFTPQFHRIVYKKILSYFTLDRVVVLKGPRRTGKSTIFYQLIDDLIRNKNVPPKNIAYISFDDPELRIDLLEILKIIERHNGLKIKDRQPIYLFLDEVHFLPNWSSLVKILFDQNLNIKIFVSGSAASLLTKQSESLAGRTIEETILPLNFSEWVNYFKADDLEFREVQFSNYLNRSGFMHLLSLPDKDLWTRMLLEDVITKAIYKDSVEIFGLREPAVLEKMLSYLSAGTSGLVNVSKLSTMLGVDRVQTGNYLNYLENTMLIFPLKKFSYHIRETIRSQEKIHVIDQGFSQIYKADKGAILESIVARHLWEKYPRNVYFWRDRLETDIVVELEGKLVPIEVKSSDQIVLKQINGLISFCREFKQSSGIVVYTGTKKEIKTEGIVVKYIPVWDFLIDLLP